MKAEFYRSLTYKDITPDELRRSNYPDKKGLPAWIEFLSQEGFRYHAVHVREHHGHYVLLCGLDKNTPDFRHIEEILAKGVHGSPEEHIMDRGDDICAVIKTRHKPTQKDIADLMEGLYMPNFVAVQISKLFYYDITKKEFEASSLPRYKLIEALDEHLNPINISVDLFEMHLKHPDGFKDYFPHASKDEQRQLIERIIASKNHNKDSDAWLEDNFGKIIEEAGVLAVGK